MVHRTKPDATQWLTFLLSFVIVLMPAARAQEQRAAPSLLVTRAEKEEFLSRATIVDEGDTSTGSKFWRVTLDDGKRKHDAAIETSTGRDPSQRDYRFNVAAYEVDKAL
jgi:hypothetical protein